MNSALGVAVDAAHVYWSQGTDRPVRSGARSLTAQASTRTSSSSPTCGAPTSGRGGRRQARLLDQPATARSAAPTSTDGRRAELHHLSGPHDPFLRAEFPGTMAVDAEHVYWTRRDILERSIGRANLDGRASTKALSAGWTNPVGRGGRRRAHLLDEQVHRRNNDRARQPGRHRRRQSFVAAAPATSLRCRRRIATRRH